MDKRPQILKTRPCSLKYSIFFLYTLVKKGNQFGLLDKTTSNPQQHTVCELSKSCPNVSICPNPKTVNVNFDF